MKTKALEFKLGHDWLCVKLLARRWNCSTESALYRARRMLLDCRRPIR